MKFFTLCFALSAKIRMFSTVVGWLDNICRKSVTLNDDKSSLKLTSLRFE